MMKKIIFLMVAMYSTFAFASEKPNVLLFLTDDQGMGDLGVYGNTIVKTPNIDSFAKESTNLMDYHVGPTCAPTRSGLMTGRNCNATGLWHTIMQRSIMRQNETTIAKVLKDNGYETGIFGKWHLGDFAPYRPMDKGFTKSVVHAAGGVGQTPDYWGNDYFDDTYFEDGKPKKFKGYCTEIWTDESIKFIEKAVADKKPFFCYVPVNAPHGPYLVDKKYSDMYEGKTNPTRAKFYGMITNLDENFKRLLDKLDELGIAENTIVIFMTDNGTACGVSFDKKTGELRDGFNANMRGTKGSPLEGGHRVPCMIRYPKAGIKEGTVDNLTANIDIMPTILELCDVDYTPVLPIQGKSLVKMLKGDKDYLKGRVLVTDSQRVDEPRMWKDSATMQDKWRLVNGVKLYDISKDPSQKNNIAKDYPEKVEELRKAYEAWFKEVFQKDYLKYSPIYVSKDILPAYLDSHYWQPLENNENAWNQVMIRKGIICNGWWLIDVLDEGEYVVELARYPLEANKAIAWGDDEPITESSGGKALDINEAQLFIDDEKVATANVDKTQKSAKFKVNFKKGEHKIQTHFKGENDLDLGAYYVYIYPAKE